jgi:hypothetical protein
MGAKRADVILLPDYIAEVGEQQFAADYQLTVRAAQSYRFRARRPRREVAARIVQDKRNPLTWDSINGYELHEPPAPPKRARRARSRA